jgi:hypothetical protein
MHGRYERNPGRLVELQPGDSRDVLDIRWRDEIAHVICVTLIGPAEGVPAGCVALVQWGAGEAEAEAEIDFGVGGVVFTLPASSIRITARCDFGPSPVEFANPPIIRVGAFASVGSGGRTSKLTRTRFLQDDLAAGASVFVDVPPFAKAVRILGGDQATRSLELGFFGVVAGALYTVEIPAGVPAPLFDLAPDVTTIELKNTAGTKLPPGARAIFELGI